MAEQQEPQTVTDRFVCAVQEALDRNLAYRATQEDSPQWLATEFISTQREIEQSFSQKFFMRSLTKLLSRGGPNRSVGERWWEVHQLIEEDWEQAKALALLALCTYSGRHADTVRSYFDEAPA